MIGRILVVCEGNLCRSPLAQALLQQALASVAVRSAGLSAVDGRQADTVIDALSRTRGIDLSTHRSARLDAHMCWSADLILAMERGQVQAIERRHPFARGRVFRLAGTVDIPDPYRRARAHYDHATALIEQGVRDWAARIAHVNGHHDGSSAATTPNHQDFK